MIEDIINLNDEIFNLSFDLKASLNSFSILFISLFSFSRISLNSSSSVDSVIFLSLSSFTGSVSIGKVGGEILLDLDYEEDSNAETDMNVVMAEGGQFIELQGTAEEAPFSKSELDDMLTLAEQGITTLIAAQKSALSDPN